MLSFRVRVPATTANFGCGFDSIGMALDLWNEITVQTSDTADIIIHGYGSKCLPRDSSNLILKSIHYAFSIAGLECPNLRIVCKNNIPLARGLGSSSAAICGGIFAATKIMQHLVVTNQAKFKISETTKYRKNIPFSTNDVFQLACDLEGHSDNASAALFGGLRVSFCNSTSPTDSQRLEWVSEGVGIPVKSLVCILFIPESTLETKEARSVIPNSIPHKDAVWNIGRACMLISILNAASIEEQNSIQKAQTHLMKLQQTLEDKLHQPYRLKQNPHLEPLMEAALKAGAFGACLSGAGPSVIVFAPDESQKSEPLEYDKIVDRVCIALSKTARRIGIKGDVQIFKPSLIGVHCDS